jgi:hypothetical protein
LLQGIRTQRIPLRGLTAAETEVRGSGRRNPCARTPAMATAQVPASAPATQTAWIIFMAMLLFRPGR